MFEWIQYTDDVILYWIHCKGANIVFDWLMPWLRNPYFWSPLYLFILIWMYRNHKKQGLIWCMFLLLVFACCDFTAASIIKPWIHRIRPCHNLLLGFNIRPLVQCGSGYSFPSAHAANHVGISLFILATWPFKQRIWSYLILGWALLVMYAQMYVVVHYPSDILAGALLGIVFSNLLSAIYLKRFGYIRL